MTISSSGVGGNNKKEEKFTSLDNLPIYPMIQNKSSATVHIRYSFSKDDFWIKNLKNECNYKLVELNCKKEKKNHLKDHSWKLFYSY